MAEAQLHKVTMKLIDSNFARERAKKNLKGLVIGVLKNR